ncbi:golgin subfamily B member 1 isoform X4 [Elephas maximus indicus]|uniref:golgin subfamily B member 1 isoform X4 n=1 Tax=Elephas maximus indicus TaxID=99487 RepID=UPI00211712B8|nr:golgin subfamily B member 1 isoform X4 [Elephas maximus indicus]
MSDERYLPNLPLSLAAAILTNTGEACVCFADPYAFFSSFPAEMLRRLSGLANIVFHELSGDGSYQDTGPPLDPEIQQEPEMEFNTTREDILERLVEELKEVIRQKDIELQQKDEALQEERKAADSKIKKIKLHAKAKVASLNKHIEEMKAQGGTVLPAESQSEQQLSKHDKSSTEEDVEIEKIKHKLQEKEELINSLQSQLIQAQAEQAAQLDKNSAELEEFVRMKQHLKEKDELISTLQAQLSQTQAEQAAQNLRVLQRKLEEHEEALSGRAQVVDLLQQELNGAEQRNQVLLQQLQEMEAEQNTLRNTLETERQESKTLLEKMELEVAERKLSFHSLQEEMHNLLEQLEQVSQAQAAVESEYRTLEQKYRAEMEDKTAHILSLRQTKQELQSSCDTLKDQNSKLLQEKNEQSVQSAQAIQQLEDQLHEKSKEISQFLTKLTLEKHETACQTSLPDVSTEDVQAVTEENIASLQNRVVELENEKGALLLSSLELELLKADNEKLSSQITLMEAQNRAGKAEKEDSQISMVDNTRLNKSNSSTEERGQDVLENTFSQKHRELSVLLLEMKEAQEEIAFLKMQLQSKRTEGDPEDNGQKEMKQMESEGIPPVGMKVLLEDTGQNFHLMSNEENSLPAIEKEEQAGTKHQNRTSEEVSFNDTGIELKLTKQDAVDKSPSVVPDISQHQQDELKELKSQISELEINFHKAEEIYEKNLDEKAKEINKLTQLIEEFKKNAENTSSAFTALSKERDQLLSQVKELSVVTELKAQIQQLEANLAEAEKQRKLDYESQTAHHNLLTEQIHSLSIETKSKDMKIEVLQNELDDVQLQFSQQSTLIKSVQSQLQKKENEVLEAEEHLRDISNKMEGLSHALSQKELEIAKLDHLLLEKKKDVETLQQTIKEKDQQVTEISFSMTEKMVQLNEEKFSLGVEIKTLKEQLNLLSKAEEAKKEQVEEVKEVVSGLKNNHDELNPAGLTSKEELQHELDLLKKESEQRKRKLQAALINRKELLQKVSRLEEELAKVRDESRKEVPLNANEKREMEEDKENKEDSEKYVSSKCQEIEISLKQTISEKEVELERVRKDLEEKVAAEEELQATVKRMNQNLQDKTNLIDLLQAQITENQAIIQKLTTSNKDAGDGDSAAPVKEKVVISPADAGGGEQWKPELEGKILDLEKEKEQLQKKLQEVLASRKVILKKAQEKERHLREELKQQKDDYNRLQEQFDEQSKDKENIGEQLRQLQIQIRESLPGIDQVESSSSTQGLEDPVFKATEQQLIHPVSESSLGPDLPSQPEEANILQSNTSIEQIKAELKEIQVEKEELELKVSSTTSELAKKSDEAFQLREQINKQVLEIQSLKIAASEAEARAESLKWTLESSQLEIAGLEHLRELQPALDELQRLVSEKEEEVSYLSGQLSEKEEIFTKVKTDTIEQEKLIKALHMQLEMQTKERDEKIKQLQVELSEMKQKVEESEKEGKAKHQIQRKLQAALISRKEALKENKGLQEELSLARDTIERLTKSLADVENQASAQNKEKDVFSKRLVLLQEERDKLIAEMDRSLLENQNLNGSCESLKLALEGLTEDKENLLKEIESLKCSQIAENTEWQEKHKELQKEYEILLQSYENVSNEAERIQHVVEAVRQEKQELYGKLRSTEASKKETEKQLQEAEQEMEEMKEKMRKFAKSKQQKILELEEENDRLRAEGHPVGDTSKECMEALLSSNSNMKEELERVRMEYKTLSKDFETIMTEKDILSQQVQDLKHQMEDNVSKQASPEATEKQDNQVDIIEEATQSVTDDVKEQDSLSMSTRPEYSVPVLSENSAEIDPDISENISSRGEINNYRQQIDQLKESIAELEKEKRKEKEFRQTLENEKNTFLSQISSKDGELKILQEEVTKMTLLNQQIQEELSRVTKLKETAEEEKDDLEERLMNQLAELNGSIGNYYQDVTDAQIKNEQLESEMQNLKKCVSELEEEKQQLVKEKSMVESEIRKEYLEKIQGAQKEPGSKSHAKELQELLKQKQQEVKQLQKDCIRYQEKISTLERTVKALEFVQSESQKDLEVCKENLARADELRKKAQAELASFRVLLDDTQSEAARVLADNLKLKKELQSNKELVKSQMKQKDDDLERRLEQAEDKHLKEKKNMQEKLDALCSDKVHLEETFGEIQVTLNKKDMEVKQLQENLDSTVAQLAAFTKSMSSLQDDRDRVIDEAKKWERKFSDAIQTKEDEIRLKEENCSVLKDQLRQMSIHMEELKINISRLEHDKQTWESKAQTEVQLQQKVCDTLQGENKELLTQLEETRYLYHNSQNELAKSESELKILRDQLTDLDNTLEKCKENKESLEEIVKQQEADIRNCKFSYEQLETDLQASRELTSRLHEEINMKEQKIISLLSAKEEAIQVAVSELHQQHDKEIKELETQLSQKEEENKKAVDETSQLLETLNTIKKESTQQKAQLDSFVKSMSSLQDDRDRVVGNYRQLEGRHLSVILEKDQLIQDAATENNKLKEEIRCLRSHMDDLNSENAKLDAELIQYREDLNQVISIKDYQQKQLLEAQHQQNKALKSEYAKLEEKLKQSEAAKENLQRSSNTLQEEKQGLSKEIESLKISISQLKGEITDLQEETTLGIFQAQLKVKEEEVQKLSTTLSSSQNRITELEEELLHVQKEAAKKVGEIEDKLKKELKHLHHDAGIMRNETETAEERVAELARDLMEMEQKLLMVTKENKDLTAQIQSFGKSMSSLQSSRDHANEELDELKRKYDASLKEVAQLREKQGLLSTERDVLVSKASSPKSSTEDNSLSHLEKLNQQLLSKDERLLHLSSQLEDSYNQMQSFSKAMASLQNERDHLLNELARFRKVEEGKQWSAAQPASSPAEVQSLKKAMSSLQNDRDRLLKELKNLQQQYLQVNQEITELRPLKAQVQEYQDKTKTFQMMQEQLRQEHLSWQHELHQLRMEKSSWEVHERSMKEQYLMALSDKDQQLSHLQNLVRELRASSPQTQNLKVQYQRQASPETSASLDGSQNLAYETELLKAQVNDSLKEIHQKELRIQQLKSKFSQLLEEKDTLSIQLCDTTQSLRETQQHCSDLFNHCAVLEKQIQELRAAPPTLYVAPGAPQEKNGARRKSDSEEPREPQPSISEAQQQLCNTKQEVSELRKLLEEERDQRVAAETALSAAEEEIRRLEHSEWDSVRTPIIGSCGTQEHVLIDLTSSSCRRTRSGAGWKRVLRSLCHSRTRVPLLAAIYFLMVHVLLILCFTGHL